MDTNQWAKEREALRRLRRQELEEGDGATTVVESVHGWHRPDELIIETSLAEDLAAVIPEARAESAPTNWRARSPIPEFKDTEAINHELERLGLNLVTFDPAGRPLAEIAAEVRTLAMARDATDGSSEAPSAHFNKVLFGESPVYQGGPGGFPSPIARFDFGHSNLAASREDVDIAVLDTGVPEDLKDLHPEILGKLLVGQRNIRTAGLVGGSDTQTPTVPGHLASEQGHGTFIFGLVFRLAPNLRIDPGRVLDTRGVGDDATITRQLLETTAPVVNLSLGSYDYADEGLVCLPRAVNKVLRQDRVVVAAAGNNGSSAPFFPAALKGVIAVGAYDSTVPGHPIAEFSNHGYWVDVWAPGVDLRSAYLVGEYPTDPARKFDGYAIWSGTSFAAPLVATEIALRYAAERKTGSALTPRQVAETFLAGLPRGEYPGRGRVYGQEPDLTLPPLPATSS